MNKRKEEAKLIDIGVTKKDFTRAKKRMPKTWANKLANELWLWIDNNDGQLGIKHFAIIKGITYNHLLELAKSNPQLQRAIEFARMAVAIRIRKEWRKDHRLAKYGSGLIEVYDDELREHREAIRNA